MTDGTVVGEDGVARCPWASAPGTMRDYHDTEWGVPVRLAHHLRALGVPQLARATVLEATLLKQGAHPTVEDGGAVPQQLSQPVHSPSR